MLNYFEIMRRNIINITRRENCLIDSLLTIMLKYNK
jgi:hypothetical protein